LTGILFAEGDCGANGRKIIKLLDGVLGIALGKAVGDRSGARGISGQSEGECGKRLAIMTSASF
jgi:hypothetical protein